MPQVRSPAPIASPDVVLALRALVARVGLSGAVRELGSNREALARILAGCPVRLGTLALVASRLGVVVELPRAGSAASDAANALHPLAVGGSR